MECPARLGLVRFPGCARRRVGGVEAVQVLRGALGQIAFLSPWLFVPLLAGLVSGMRRWRQDRRLFLLCLSLPPIILFTAAPLWIEKGQPHWSMAGWFFVFPLMGAWAKNGFPVRNLRRYAFLSVALLAALTASAAVEARTGWLWRLLPAGTTDPTLEVLDWSGLAKAPLLQPSPPLAISDALAGRWQDRAGAWAERADLRRFGRSEGLGAHERTCGAGWARRRADRSAQGSRRPRGLRSRLISRPLAKRSRLRSSATASLRPSWCWFRPKAQLQSAAVRPAIAGVASHPSDGIRIDCRSGDRKRD